MPRKRMVIEYGMGTSLRRQDYTQAARRAVENALWRNSLTLAELFGFARDDMRIEVEIGVQKPEAVDTEALKGIFPYGAPEIRARHGGLDTPKPDGNGATLIANCAIIVSFDMDSAAQGKENGS
ncbi:hypothetical protein BV394_00675 [Brevirhabdus pacifica]|uniref:Uncharacterized protein n=1 Tax=Brevirhabdus pacifica TaxID=1267768 RepID=A0A1U7DEP6_9RHOB|nr:Lin0512 family protein [Brevirhabdus pacifica]APX88426.1 hypothetical protein BV394_00675 [Brevirhabdus pacifica]OWU79734.1 hypothetical protein ATO5_01370 [Loktanella sp. 22II-4b]PJJ87110.1 uncharacterized protein (TIGR02058 family) [Brevirhabdus pacifica]